MGHVSSVNILIVEDEENIALALEAVIDKAFKCDRLSVANNGEEALQLLNEFDYDLIISDWNMPKMAGDQLLVEVRKESRTKHIPFILLTARSDTYTVNVALQVGDNE